VPSFVFDMTYAISGAQLAEAFAQTLEAGWQAEMRQKSGKPYVSI
jgi:predicted DsbA family dithiol-disulfide isomerase